MIIIIISVIEFLKFGRMKLIKSFDFVLFVLFLNLQETIKMYNRIHSGSFLGLGDFLGDLLGGFLDNLLWGSLLHDLLGDLLLWGDLLWCGFLSDDFLGDFGCKN